MFLVWCVTIFIVNDKPIIKKKFEVDSTRTKTDSIIIAFDSVTKSEEKKQTLKISQAQKEIEEERKQKELFLKQREIERHEKEKERKEKEVEKQEREKERLEKEKERQEKQMLEEKYNQECQKRKKLEDYYNKTYKMMDTSGIKY